MQLRSPLCALRHHHTLNTSVILDHVHTLPSGRLLEQPTDGSSLSIPYLYNGCAAIMQELGRFRNEAPIEEQTIIPPVEGHPRLIASNGFRE